MTSPTDPDEQVRKKPYQKHLEQLSRVLNELKSSGKPDTLTEAKTLAQKMYSLAITDDQQAYSFAAMTLILQSKLAAVAGEIHQAMEYLENARKIAEEKNLRWLVQDALVEHDMLILELEKWEELTLSKTSVQRLLNKARLDEHLKEMEKITENLGRD